MRGFASLILFISLEPDNPRFFDILQ